VTTLVLARLLTPEAFGLVSLALVVIVLVDHLKDLGTGPAIIQRPHTPPGLLDAVFLLNVVLGTTLTAVVALTAVPVVGLMGQPEAAPVLAVMALLPLITAFGQTHLALLRRSMNFTAIAKVAVVDAGVSSVVSVVLALLGRDVWAIVVGTLAGAVASTAYLWRESRWRPGRNARLEHLRSIWRFSIHLFAANLAWFVFLGQADKFVVGKWLGLSALGVYALAQRTVSYPLASVGSVIGQVLFPALARLQDDPQAMGRAFARTSAAAAVLLFPAMTGVAIVARPASESFLSPEWQGLAPLVWILAPAGAVQAVAALSYHLTTAIGRSDWTLRWQLVQALVFVISYVAGLPWGVVGVALSYGLACLAMAPVGVAISLRLIGFPLRAYVSSLAPAVFGTILMAVVALTASTWLYSPIAQLGVAVLAGVLTYVGFMLWLRPTAWTDSLAMLRRRIA
jgi:PST family polysaccharide transporter